MASGFPGRDLHGGFSVQMPLQQQRSDGADISASGLLKRSLTELERQQQIQHAFFLRSVKQRTQHLASTIGFSCGAPFAASPGSSSLTSTTTTSSSSGLGLPSRNLESDLLLHTVPAPAESERKSAAMRSQLLELERHLLDDDDEEEDVASASVSAITASDWGDTMQQIISPPPPPPPMAAAAAAPNAFSSPSPTNSSSSSASSSASCSPGSGTPSRQLLLETAAAIAEGNAEAASCNLSVLKRTANPRGDPDQRLAAMMTAALLSRVNPPLPEIGHNPIAELCSAEHQASTQLLHELSPCFKLALLASNLAILDATRDSTKIHIVDFDVGQGAQYASLLHALVDRHRMTGGKPPAVKITAVCDPKNPLNCFDNGDKNGRLKVVGDRIAKLAERVGVALQFTVVSRPPAELDSSSLGCEPDEAVAVNFAFHLSRVADESVSPANPRDELLRLARRLSPRAVVVAEQEMSGNTAPFAARFAEACGHHGAVLETLEGAAAEPERARAEGCVARRAVNSVAREGPERVERCEVFGKWRARMGMAGLRAIPICPAVSEPVRARLKPAFTVKEEAGGLCFAWMGRVLTVVSAWR